MHEDSILTRSKNIYSTYICEYPYLTLMPVYKQIKLYLPSCIFHISFLMSWSLFLHCMYYTVSLLLLIVTDCQHRAFTLTVTFCVFELPQEVFVFQWPCSPRPRAYKGLWAVSSPSLFVRGPGLVCHQPYPPKNVREMCRPCTETARDANPNKPGIL